MGIDAKDKDGITIVLRSDYVEADALYTQAELDRRDRYPVHSDKEDDVEAEHGEPEHGEPEVRF